MGSPLNFPFSTVLTCTLNRASRRAPQMRYRNEAIHPHRPKPDRAHPYTRNAGAAPKAITSARESYSTPNRVVVPVIRATRPSSPSKIAAPTIAIAAFSKPPV